MTTAVIASDVKDMHNIYDKLDEQWLTTVQHH